MCSNRSILQVCLLQAPKTAGALQVVGFDTVGDGWVSPSAAAADVFGLSSFALGSRAGAGMPFSVHSIWALPQALAVDTIAAASGNASLDATLAAMTATHSPPDIALDPSSVLTGLVVDAPVRVVVNALAGSSSFSSDATALGINLRLTFFGATPM
jgi:hypothetical protein